MDETIIDAQHSVLGRMASQIAERLLKGESIVIVNAEKAIINGTKDAILKKYRRLIGLRAKGNPEKGPKFTKKRADMLFRQAVKGMLPAKTPRGKKAFKNCKVFIGMPAEYAEKEKEKLKGTEMQERKSFLSIEELSRVL